MYRYKTLNGKTPEAESLRGIAEALWRLKLVPEPTLEAWMLGSAKRAKDWNGSTIRTSSPEDHVRDLVEAGLLAPLASLACPLVRGRALCAASFFCTKVCIAT